MTTRERVDAAIAAMQAADASAACAHFTDDAVYQEAKRSPIVGRASIHTHFARFFLAVKRFRFDVDAVLVEGAGAVVVYRFGVPESGATRAGSDSFIAERAGCAVVSVESGGIASWREYEG